MTTHGVPAIDFGPEGYPSVFGSTLDTQHANMSPLFRQVLEGLQKANCTWQGWVINVYMYMRILRVLIQMPGMTLMPGMGG